MSFTIVSSNELTAVRVSEREKLSAVVNGYGDRAGLEGATRVVPSNYHGEHLVRVVLAFLVVKDGDGEAVSLVAGGEGESLVD